jgi:sigma-B regulation protein RsbU (phosphoserine phosphatase)
MMIFRGFILILFAAIAVPLGNVRADVIEVLNDGFEDPARADSEYGSAANWTEGRYDVANPTEVARRLNRQFPLIERSGQFFTFLYGILDVETRVVRYVKAGHPGPIVVSRDGVRCLEKGGGIPIGILPDAEYEEEQVALSPGDSLIFYTDGVFETFNAQREVYGLDRMIRTIAAAGGGISEHLRALQLSLDAFGRGGPRRDDVTFVGLGVN